MVQSGMAMSVLVVDDNQHMRAIIKELLKALGPVVIREAADPVEAFEVLSSVPIDLVLTDLSMPMIDGVEFTRMIRTGADSPNRFLPIVMITGHTERSRIMAARDAGVNEILVKPVTARALVERLKVVIEKPRPFVTCAAYFGPDRRRKTTGGHAGPFRRASDLGEFAKQA